MAELSTIARPYAEGLWQALTEHKTSAAKIAKIGQVLESLADMAKDPQVSELVRDPKLTDDQIFEAVTGALGKGLSPELSGLIRVVIENGRLEALPEIAAQYRALKTNPKVSLTPTLRPLSLWIRRNWKRCSEIWPTDSRVSSSTPSSRSIPH